MSFSRRKVFSMKLSWCFISWYFPVNFISCLSWLADLKINASAAPCPFIFYPHLGSVAWSQMFNTRIWSCSHPSGRVVLGFFFCFLNCTSESVDYVIFKSGFRFKTFSLTCVYRWGDWNLFREKKYSSLYWRLKFASHIFQYAINWTKSLILDSNLGLWNFSVFG